MSSVRELLELAAPAAPALAPPVEDVRRAGDRRRRQHAALGGLVATVAVGVAVAVGLQVAGAPGAAPVSPVAPPSSSPSQLPGVHLQLEGTRWVPVLDGFGLVATEAPLDDPGPGARALVTFATGGRLFVDVMLDGRTTTVEGTWEAASDAAAVGASSRGEIRMSLTAPADAPSTVTFLVIRLALASTFSGEEGPPESSSFSGVGLYLYSRQGTTLAEHLFEVRADAVLPAPYLDHR